MGSEMCIRDSPRGPRRRPDPGGRPGPGGGRCSGGAPASQPTPPATPGGAPGGGRGPGKLPAPGGKSPAPGRKPARKDRLGESFPLELLGHLVDVGKPLPGVEDGCDLPLTFPLLVHPSSRPLWAPGWPGPRPPLAFEDRHPEVKALPGEEHRSVVRGTRRSWPPGPRGLRRAPSTSAYASTPSSSLRGSP